MISDHRKRFFDAASIAMATPERSHGIEMVKQECGGWEQACIAAEAEFADLLSNDPRVDTQVALFRNATQAARRVIFTLRQHLPPDNQGVALLTTDEEYSSLLASIDEIWPGPVYVLQWSKLLGEPEHAEKSVDALIQAIRSAQPRVIVLSHVTRATGFWLKPDDLKKIRDEADGAFILLDSAEAVGNISAGDLTQSLWESDSGTESTSTPTAVVDAMITSGHKWLGGETSTGFLWTAESDRLNEFRDPAESESRTQGAGGTGDLEAVASVIWAIRYDRGTRALEWREVLDSNAWLQCRAINYDDRQTGILTLRVAIPCSHQIQALARRGFRLSTISSRPVRDDKGIQRAGAGASGRARYFLPLSEEGNVEGIQEIDFKNLCTHPYAHGPDGVDGRPIEGDWCRDKSGRVVPCGGSSCSNNGGCKKGGTFGKKCYLRLSLHHYHGEADLNGLVQALEEVLGKECGDCEPVGGAV